MSQQATIKPDAAPRDNSKSAGPAYAMVLIVLGAFTLVMSTAIQRPDFVDQNDPGPASAPVATATFLVVGGIVLLVQWICGIHSGALCRARSELTETRSVSEEPNLIPRLRFGLRRFGSSLLAAFGNKGNQNVALVTVGLGLYIGAIGLAGFSLSTFLFSTAMMIRLGTRWWVAGIVTGIVLVVVHLVFVFMFRVSLPEGWFDMNSTE
jgi:hypothetical protein